jgi:hypothetical protein
MTVTRDSEKRTCLGICKQYKIKKPTGKVGRYESGQARCQMCDIWIDHNGCILKDRSPATIDSLGWTCKCCNYRVRQKPRNLVYKEKLREKKQLL